MSCNQQLRTVVIPTPTTEPEELKTGFPYEGAVKENEFVVAVFEGYENDPKGRICCRRKGCFLKPVPQLFGKRFAIQPKDKSQCMAMDLLMDRDLEGVLLTGPAGSGKTLLSLAAGVAQCESGHYEEILYVKPLVTVGGKDLGFFPGSIDEKLDEWVQPIWENMYVLKPGFDPYNDRDAIVTPVALPYCRGRTFRKSYIILDETQNINRHELKSMVTRCGEGTKLVMLADKSQIDNGELSLDGEDCGATLALQAFEGASIFGAAELEQCYRNGLARLAIERL